MERDVKLGVAGVPDCMSLSGERCKDCVAQLEQPVAIGIPIKRLVAGTN